MSFDAETDLIRPACYAPPLVCVTWQEVLPDGRVTTPEIAHVSTAEPLIHGWLSDPEVRFVGHNVAYDFGVAAERFPHLRAAIFSAYAADRVTDTMIRQQLLDVAAGIYQRKIEVRGKAKGRPAKKLEYTLEALADRCAGIRLQKDGWRLSYGRFLDVPLERWVERAREVQAEARPLLAALEAEHVTDPENKDRAKRIEGLREMIASEPEQCVRYPLDDARATLAVYVAQEKHATYLADQFRQARAAWALHLNSAWGLRTDEAGVANLRRVTQEELDTVEAWLMDLGLVKPDGVRDTKAAKARMIAICRRDGLSIPRTETHWRDDAECGGAEECEEHVCLDAEACEETGDPVLKAYANLSTLKKVLSNDVKALQAGIVYPVHTRYGFAATGRSTSAKPNIQNVRREEPGKPGIRETFVPRPGRVFAQADFPQLELYTLAQCCVTWLGQSKLAEALLAGLDPHLAVAASMLGIPYAEAKAIRKAGKSHPRYAAVNNARQLAKVLNFGFPGGLGFETFLDFAKASLSREEFEALGLACECRGARHGDGCPAIAKVKDSKELWFSTWPEMPHYFARVNALCDNDAGRAFVETLFTGRWRGNASYCAACNNGFQALGADCAKEACWRVARAEYVGTPSANAVVLGFEVSPLFNGRSVAFVHDEIIAEVDDGPTAHDAAHELGALMVEGANLWLPDVPIALEKMEPLLMRRWSKNAEPVKDANGRLVPWEPKAAA